MAIKQLSVFVGNNNGTLAHITDVLAKNNINLLAISLADTQDYGILRVIVNDIKLAKSALDENKIIASSRDVVAVSIPNESGGLSKVLNILSDNNISVEYSYSFTFSQNGNAYVVLRVNDNDATEKLLSAHGIKLLFEEDILSK